MNRNYQAFSTGVVGQNTPPQMSRTNLGAAFMQTDPERDCSESADPIVCFKDYRSASGPRKLELRVYKIWKTKFRRSLRISISFVSFLLNSGYACRFSLRKLLNHCTCSTNKEKLHRVDAQMNALAIRSNFGGLDKIQLAQYYSSVMVKLNLSNETLGKGVSKISLLCTQKETEDFWNKMETHLLSKIPESNEDEHFIKCQEQQRQEHVRLLTGLSIPCLIQGKKEKWTDSLQKILDLDPGNIFSLLHLGSIYLNSEGNLEKAQNIAEKLSQSLKNEMNLVFFFADVASGYNYMGPKYCIWDRNTLSTV